ncbi:hypothetical protein O6H91_20G059500 [Diphasiastrum complanatum]|uniref:Uncharacterized protein n=1 Tax=Diphasiastrum complanatum TaxID=34168 RepID=A0ACC2AR07_DIPCM|nr:hypothetical protein O6H91_Y361300 [Diphasiastrum complanatum]KAJ7519890.1 hypothetical protein O6H91_20G059500 [Diphasiastrum complanatum]
MGVSAELWTHASLLEFWRLIWALVFFHSSEFVLALVIHGRHNVSWRSFLISRQYIFAMICGLLEHTFESLLLPALKHTYWMSNTGLALVILGEVIRKLAILTAYDGFTHDIKFYHREGHELVTHGIYRFMRHPGYAGFFMWSIGTQLMLCNPLCTLGYAVVLWRFFKDRIATEEYFLHHFFGERYEEYSLRVPSGIPFVQ